MPYSPKTKTATFEEIGSPEWNFTFTRVSSMKNSDYERLFLDNTLENSAYTREVLKTLIVAWNLPYEDDLDTIMPIPAKDPKILDVVRPLYQESIMRAISEDEEEVRSQVNLALKNRENLMDSSSQGREKSQKATSTTS